MSIGGGVAIAGIWIAVGLMSFNAGQATPVIGLFAAALTAVILGKR